MFIFRKKFRQLFYGYEDPFENSKKWANFTKNFSFLSKNANILYTRVDIFFAYFLKRSREVLGRTSVGGNLRRTSVGGNIRTNFSNWLKLGHIVHQDRYFFTLFIIRRRKVLGRTSGGRNLRSTSVGGTFESTSAGKNKLEGCRQDVLGRMSVGGK